MQKVGLIKTCGYERKALRDGVERIFSFYGGAGAIFKSGESVLLKPNLLFARDPSRHVTTHPEVVFAVGSVLRDLGCRLTIGDSPGFGSAVSVAEKCGIGAAARELGARVVNFSEQVEITNGRPGSVFKRFTVAREVAEADRIVNIPKLKSHGQMLLTMAVKNMFGSVVGVLKPQWHFKAGRDAELFARMLVELCLALETDFTVMDGIVGMEGNGPGSGDPRELGVLIGGPDPVAVDTVAASLLKVGRDRYFTGRAALAMGLPGAKLDDIEVAGDPVSLFDIKDFRLPQIIASDWRFFGFVKRWFRALFTPAPEYHYEKCRFCMVCEELCPAKAITAPAAGESESPSGGAAASKDPGRGGTTRAARPPLAFDLQKCIRCFCCQEMCPHGAITVRPGAAQRIADSFGLGGRRKGHR